MKLGKEITIGIDAANLRGGGGVTHLVELLRAAQPMKTGITRIVVWGGKPTLDAIDARPWIEKCNPSELDRGLLQRTLWQRYKLSQIARDAGCHVLFVPGGSYAGNFHTVITMSQNLLPFEYRELRRYGWSIFTLKMLLLRFIQSRSYRQADGVIFLTNYARQAVLSVTGKLHGITRIIPHGLNQRFIQAPKAQKVIADYDNDNPYRILYVSVIDEYKHQWNVVDAIAALRKMNLPVVLDLIGPAYPPALMRLNRAIDSFDDARTWVRYHGSIPFDELHLHYAKADLGLFASSCENMPNILLETMASGLPIACSNRGPMPEMLGEGGIYFDPEKIKDIVCALRVLIDTPYLRTEMAQANYQQAQLYSWDHCAQETFKLLSSIAQP